MEIDAFFGMCDETNFCAVQAVRQVGSGQIIVVCTLSICNLNTGEHCIRMLNKSSNGETVEYFFTIEMEIINKDNVDAYLAVFGLIRS